MSALHRSSSAPLKNGIPPKELLDDLCSRFVLNVPKEDQQSFERILFLVEYAHWFYEDNSVEKNPSLKSFTLKEFTSLMFNSCDVLKPYVPHIDDIFKDFTSYKVKVPVTGAIILDETFERCLLVKGWKGTSWSFPRGKKNKDEEDHTCAVREVLEETGFDVSKLLKKDDHIEMIFGQQRVRLYIVGGVKDDTSFAPQTKKEISIYPAPSNMYPHISDIAGFPKKLSYPIIRGPCATVSVLEIAWQRLDELQPINGDVISRGITGLKLYMVAPFLKSLRSWISAHQPLVAPKPGSPVKGITVWKARGSSTGSGSMLTENPSSKPSTVATAPDTGPGCSFRNFKFDLAPVFLPLQKGFSV